MADLISMLSAASGATAEADPNFKQTVLLLHGDGTNGAQNNTFLDSSTNNFTITRNGNTTQGTFSPFSLAAGEWSNYFDGTGDFLTAPAGSAFAYGTGNFTVEAWVYADSFSAEPVIWAQTANTINYFLLYITAAGLLEFRFAVSGGGTPITSSSALTVRAWNHIALVREGTGSNQTKLYINGVNVATSTCSQDFTNTTYVPTIGRYTHTAAQLFAGYISNVRVLKGTAQYTSAFTPPTAPLTAITNTSLLTCQSNRFVDNSTNAFAITRNGDVRVTPFSPFAPSAAYDAGTNGGSGYFDGAGDYLSVADNAAFSFGTGAFTIEAWVYGTGPGAVRRIYHHQNAADSNDQVSVLQLDTNKLNFFVKTSPTTICNIVSTNNLISNAWNHIVCVRDGSNFAAFINGQREGTASSATTAPNPSGSVLIGTVDGSTEMWVGYVASLRVVKGTAVYDPTQTTLNVPTAPLTAITNTSLLLNFTNAGIFDNTGKNNLETVGNAQIDTTTKKYGTGSLEFDGTGDWLLMPNTPDQQLGTGNFTIEFWVYLASGDTGSARGLVAKGGASTGWLVSLDSSQKVVFTYTTSTITSSGAITTNAWNHIAVVRSGTGSNQTKIYIGGTNDGTGTVSTDFNQTESMYVGANRTGGDPMKGFIDDLRITKGIARYTANFSVPGKAFPDL